MYNSVSGANSLEVNNVEVVYNNGHTALSKVTFNLDKGVIAALVGINGSGKSTLFKAIMGFLPLKTGTIKLLGLNIDSALKKNLIAYVPQNEEIDWDEREKELEELCNKHRKNDGSYDVIVPSSGGKDSAALAVHMNNIKSIQLEYTIYRQSILGI